MADKRITRRLSIYINGEEVDATISNLRKNLAKFRAQANRATEGSEDWRKYNAEVAKLELELNQATNAQKAFRQDVKLTEQGLDASTASLQDFTGGLSNLFQGIKKGDYLQVSEGWKSITTGIKGATRAAIAFIATPIGLAITALAGIAFAAKSWFDYNNQIVEALKLTQQITGLTDEAADQARIRAEALVEVFDVDFKETLETARNLSQQFGISFQEAFDVVEDQLVRGQKNNDEFFQSLKEYPTFFAQAGFSAQEFGKIIAAGYDLGIYNDKLPDALKEADLALREQTQTTRDALLNAFGAPFTDDILRRVRIGEITTKEALEEISKQADVTGINVQQNAQLTADLFKGAGEDAGGALKVFEAVNVALNQQQRELTEAEQVTQEQITATKELKAVSSALFSTGASGFGLLINRAKLFGTKILVDILNKGVDVVNWLITLNNKTGFFSGLITALGGIVTRPFKILIEVVRNTISGIQGLGKVLEGVFTFDFDKVKEGATEAFEATTKTLTAIPRQLKEEFDDVYDSIKNRKPIELITVASISAEDETTAEDTGATTGTSGEDNTEGLTPEDQKKLDSRKKLYELLKEIEEEQAIQEELDKLDKEEQAEEEEILRTEKKYEDLIAEAEFDKELQKGFEEAKEFELQEIRDKYAEEDLEKDKKKKQELLKQQYAFVKELLKAEDNYQNAKKKALDFGLATLQNFFGKQNALGIAAFAFEKGVAVAEVIKETAKANAIATANEATIPAILPPGIPNPFKPVSLALTAKQIAANKLNAAVQIGTILGTAVQGFEQGGFTEDNPTIAMDGNKKVKGFVHDNEYVIPAFVRKEPEVPQIIEYLERKRLSKLQGFELGGESKELNNDIPNVIDNNMPLAQAITKLNELLDQGIFAKINFTLETMLKIKEFEDKINKTTNAAQN